MVKDVVKSIVEAESKADRITSEGGEKAGEIISQANLDAEKILEKGAKDVRSFVASEQKRAKDDADKQASEFIAESKSADIKFAEKAKSNMDKAVKVILESLND